MTPLALILVTYALELAALGVASVILICLMATGALSIARTTTADDWDGDLRLLDQRFRDSQQ